MLRNKVLPWYGDREKHGHRCEGGVAMKGQRISRRRMLELAGAAGGLALALPYGRAARAQVVKRIDTFAPEFDKIIDTSEPILELGTGFGGGGNAEGPVWWHEG